MRYGLKCAAKNARTASEFAPSMRMPSAHGVCHRGCVFGLASNARQPMTNAGHAAATGSAAKPGSSLHAAGVNTARGEVAVGGTLTGGGGGGDTVWQPLIAMHAATLKAATAAAGRDRWEGVAMEWFLLEALVALLIAVVIVWWTMSARRKPPAPPTLDARDKDRQ